MLVSGGPWGTSNISGMFFFLFRFFSSCGSPRSTFLIALVASFFFSFWYFGRAPERKRTHLEELIYHQQRLPVCVFLVLSDAGVMTLMIAK